jgi:hypothetical protein
MLNANQFLEQERRRLDEEAQALARVKETILPPKRYVEPPAVPDATATDLRNWQAAILSVFVGFTLTVLKSRHAGRTEILIWVVGSLVLLVALAYTRYRMVKLKRAQEHQF